MANCWLARPSCVVPRAGRCCARQPGTGRCPVRYPPAGPWPRRRGAACRQWSTRCTARSARRGSPGARPRWERHATHGLCSASLRTLMVSPGRLRLLGMRASGSSGTPQAAYTSSLRSRMSVAWSSSNTTSGSRTASTTEPRAGTGGSRGRSVGQLARRGRARTDGTEGTEGVPLTTASPVKNAGPLEGERLCV